MMARNRERKLGQQIHSLGGMTAWYLNRNPVRSVAPSVTNSTKSLDDVYTRSDVMPRPHSVDLAVSGEPGMKIDTRS